MASKTKTKAKKPAAAKKGKSPQKAKTAKTKPAAKTKAPAKTAKPKAAPKQKADTLSPKNVSKTLSIMTVLKTDKGATIDEIVKITDWLPHTARAHLSRLRKKLAETKDGLQLVKYTRDGKTMYKLEDPEQA